MANSTTEIWFRPARVGDYEEVIALREVHEGWDPLPYCYHKMLADPQILGIVGESNDGIVSMTSRKMFHCRDELLEKRVLACLRDHHDSCHFFQEHRGLG